MYRTLMVPLDGSEFAEEALPMARLLAARFGAGLHLVHVIRPFPDSDLKSPGVDMDWVAEARSGTEGYLEEWADRIRGEDGTRVDTAVLEGRVVPALREYAGAHGVDLVILTTHGAGGMQRWWLGSVADGLVRTARRHLLLVRPWDDTEDHAPGEPRFERVLVPLDGSRIAERALAPARSIAREFEAEITLLRVVPAPVQLTSIYGLSGVRLEGEGHRERLDDAEAYLSGVAEGLEGLSVSAAVVEEGEAARGVLDAARESAADLLVLSTRGRGGVARAVVGSVADKIIRGTALPALVVPIHDEE